MTAAVDFCGIDLDGPLLNASGTWDPLAARRVFGEEAFSLFPFDAHVTKTITLQPRQGNPPPRIWESSASLINSIGLPNKGLDRWREEDLPVLRELPVPLIVNVMGFSTEELKQLVAGISGEEGVAAIELNVSCPNVETGTIIGSDPIECERTVAAVRGLTELPLIVKITPNASDPASVAAAAESAGASAVSLINTLRGMAFDPGSGMPWLGAGTGGVSGPAVLPIALAQVAAVRMSVEIPVIGMGGVHSGRSAAEMLAAGAALVAVGTESFRDPLAVNRIRAELNRLQ